MDDQRGDIHEAHVFLGILSFIQLIFAWATLISTACFLPALDWNI